MPLENIVSHYGLHPQIDGVNYLVQDGRTADNFVGLPERPPYEVRSRFKGPCPHIIPVSPARPDPQDWEALMHIVHDPLVQALLPIPKVKYSKIPYFYDEDGTITRWALNLCRLASPKGPLAMGADKLRIYIANTYLCNTNLAPLILTDVGIKVQSTVDELARMTPFLPRKLVVFGRESHFVVRDPMLRQTTKLGELISEDEFMMLPMELLGAHVLRKYARGEEIK